MSVFIVSDNQINTILSYVNRNASKNPYYGASDFETLLQIGKMFTQSNQISYCSRYRIKYCETDYPEFEFKLIPTHNMSPLQFVKYLDCLEYQCNEADNYENSETDKLINRWRNSTISQLPEYQAANWAIA